MSTAAYADLMFAWANARLGAAAEPRALAAPAVAALTGTGDRAHEWAAAAFQYRIDQALSGYRHAGGWPIRLADQLGHLDDDRGVTASRRYPVARLLQMYRTIEPDRRPDPYVWSRRFTAQDSFGREIDNLETAPDAEGFARQFGRLMAEVDDPAAVDRLARVLTTAANGGDRVTPDVADTVFRYAFGIIDRFLRTMPAAPAKVEAVRDVVSQVLDLAVARRETEFVGRLGARLVDWARFGDHDAGREAAAILFAGLIPALYRLDMLSELASLLDIIDETEAPVGKSVSNPDPQTLLLLAGCDLWLGRTNSATKALESVRCAFVGEASARPRPDAVVRLAVAYARAVGMAPVAVGGPLLLDLLQKLPAVPNGFTTATHFSRLHLDVTEAVVLAAATEDFNPPAALVARVGGAEVIARRGLLAELRTAVVAWASPDWGR